MGTHWHLCCSRWQPPLKDAHNLISRATCLFPRASLRLPASTCFRCYIQYPGGNSVSRSGITAPIKSWTSMRVFPYNQGLLLSPRRCGSTQSSIVLAYFLTSCAFSSSHVWLSSSSVAEQTSGLVTWHFQLMSVP